MTGGPPPGRRGAGGPARREGRSPHAAEDDAPDAAAVRADHARAAKRGLLLLGVVAAIGCVQVIFMIGVELDRTLRHRASIVTLEAELEDLRREAAGLRAVVRHAGSDAYREQLARRQGFMYADETRVVVLPTSIP